MGCAASGRAAEELSLQGLDNISDEHLRNALLVYYKAEKELDWKTTYDQRSNGFKRTVEFETYAGEMTKAMAGWNLKNLEILSSHNRDNRVVVKILFIESIDSEAVRAKYGFPVPTDTVRFTEDTVWEEINGKWIAVDAGTRNHLPLNRNLAE